ncbi:MAG: Cna B-type domain-containing protein [Oscillospiraceae bacterium]|nr:Cna B-type domain-containing protein [Oscillospiraceae bacterium]MDY3064891.1 Cna B-type domain-containing protein [Oscillospiraceae bacterium]
MKKNSRMKKLLSLLMTCLVVMSLGVSAFAAGTAEIADGVTVLKEGATDVTYNVGEGKVIALVGSADEQNPVVFKDCTFNLSGKTMSPGRVDGLTYAVGETYTKLLMGGNIRFENCTFVSENGVRSSTGGNDVCMYIGSGNIVFDGSEIKGADYVGQFFGLFYDANVTLNNSTIATTGNTGGWSYAMYGTSVLNLNGSTMTATGMKRLEGGGNVNAFYSGDLRTNYDAINIKDSTVNFSDNYGGGFAINRVNIHVDHSTITVNDNAGNATNSGVWYVKDSEITMSGNRTHGFSHIGDEMENTTLTIEHNGYAGYYITDDASYKNCTVNIRCNGERYLSYSAGDVWLNGHTMTFTDCDSVWLGGVGRKGTIASSNCGSFVAYDLYENKLKSNTESVLTGVELSAQDAHILFLNPELDFDYARGNTEGEEGSSNDDDLFADVAKETVIGKDTAKIGTLTTAQLSHHEYDWMNGEITDAATADTYGVVRYACKDACADYLGRTEEHPDGFDCRGVYVYAPLCGLTFEKNTDDASVTNMPATQDQIAYGSAAAAPESNPVREGYAFTGWYLDPECTQKADLDASLTANWTVVYAGWAEQTEISVTKVWNDANDKDGLRPDGVLVILLANGEETDHVLSLNEENGWKGVFTGINKYDENGEAIVYTIKEASVDGYLSAVSGDAATGFVITNTHTPAAEQPDTGDYTTMETIIMIATLAGIAVLGTILLAVKHRQKR